MAGISDSMKLLVTPALIAQIGQKLGMEPVMVEKGAELVLPLILGGGDPQDRKPCWGERYDEPAGGR